MTFLYGIFVAVLSAWVTVLLSLNKFRTEKWWELRADTYKRLIESLHHQNAYAKKAWMKKVEGATFEQKYWEKVIQLNRDADAEMIKIYDSGSFILSESAYKVLGDYIKFREGPKAPSYEDHIEELGANSKKCLEEIVILAKKELSPSPWPYFDAIKSGPDKLKAILTDSSR